MWTSFSTVNPLVLVSLFKSFIHGLHKLHILKCTWKGSLLFFLQRYCFPESTRKTARQSRTWSTLDLVSLVCWMISTARLMKSSFHCNAMQQSQCNFWYGGWYKWCTSNCMSWQAHGVVLCWLGSRFQKPVMLLISLSEKCNSMLIFYVISYHFCSFIGNYANSMQNLCKNYASPTNSFICLMHNSCKKMLDLCKIYAIYIHIIARLMQMINATFVQD